MPQDKMLKIKQQKGVSKNYSTGHLSKPKNKTEKAELAAQKDDSGQLPVASKKKKKDKKGGSMTRKILRLLSNQSAPEPKTLI